MYEIKKIGYIERDREQRRVHDIDGIMPTITENNSVERRHGGLIIEYEGDNERGDRSLENVIEESLDCSFTYASLFSGVGGFERALNKLGGNCVFASEIDKFASQTYTTLYGDDVLHGDITKIKAEDVPDHDLLVGGFPCQEI